MRNFFYKELFSLCAFFLTAGSSHGQKLMLSSYGSYVFDGTYHIYYANANLYEGIINHGPQLGLAMEYVATPNYCFELSYFRRNTTVSPAGTINGNGANPALRFHYALLGITAYPQNGFKKLQGYGGLSAGMIIQTASNPKSIADNTVNHALVKFAWATKLGGIFWMSGRAGLKLQAQWLSALQFKNGDVNFDVHRPGTAPAENSIVNQFELGTGFVIKLGKAKDKK